jgi:EAL domain-containing protein (putative c-di-GMP-specific phosphodiesterase class I)
MISPDAFIPLAEETGLIVPVGGRVLAEACRTARGWPIGPGSQAPQVRVNLSLRQLRLPTLVSQIRTILNESGLEPDRLELEITESAAMETIRPQQRTLWDLRDLGVRLSLDDFGSGQSSLTHLRELPVETVKIDRDFVHSSAFNSRDAAIARAIIQMAHSLNMRVVAEGVDSPEVRDFLEQEGCDAVQGYLFHRPMDTTSLLRLLEEGVPATRGWGPV